MARNFQTSTHRIRAAGTAFTSGAFSYFAVIKPDAANSVGRQIINQHAADDENWLEFGTGGTNQLAFGFFDGSSYPQVTWTSGFTAGTEHRVFGIYDGASQYIYADVDATAKISGAASAPSAVQSPDFDIGNNDALGRIFDGQISEVAFWFRALSSGERLALGNGASPLFFPDGLELYLPLVRDIKDLANGRTITTAGTSVVDHPRIIYPSNYQIAPFAAAAPASSTYPGYYGSGGYF